LFSKEKVKSKESVEHLIKEAKESESNKLLSSILERYHTPNAPNQIAFLILYLKEKVVPFSFSISFIHRKMCVSNFFIEALDVYTSSSEYLCFRSTSKNVS
jgi:hypothetical protein